MNAKLTWARLLMPRMNRNRRRLVIAAVGVAMIGTVTAVALGSPGSGRVTTLLVAKADNNETVQLNSDRIKLQTKGPTDVRVQTITFAPGGYSGWNHKPGFVIVAVQSGEVTKFDSQCNGTTYGPNSPNGAVFVEYGDDPEEVRNTSSAPATVYATQVAPDADPPVFRIEDDPPPCA
jgi:hypothetical protein